MFKSTFLFISILLIITGCQQKEVDLAEEKEILLNTDKEFSAYSEANGAAEAFRKFLSEDALQFSAGRNVIFGNEAVYKIMSEGDEDYQLTWEPQFADVAKSGDLGWSWGYYNLKIKEAGEERYGKYVNVWKKNEIGEWKVAADIGNPGPDISERSE